jgi:hypothetical protein
LGIKTMKKLSQMLVFGVAAAATLFTTLAPAEAGHRHWHNRDRGDAVALGVLGLAAGAIIGGAIADSNNNRRVYIDPAPTYYPPQPTYYPPAPSYQPAFRPAPVYHPAPAYRPAPVYRPVVSQGFQPWSPAWYDYCSRRYRSFDPSSGTFVGYDGQERFCVAN